MVNIDFALDIYLHWGVFADTLMLYCMKLRLFYVEIRE